MLTRQCKFREEGADAIMGGIYVEDGDVSNMDNKTIERYFDYKAFGRYLSYDYQLYNGYAIWIQ